MTNEQPEPKLQLKLIFSKLFVNFILRHPVFVKLGRQYTDIKSSESVFQCLARVIIILYQSLSSMQIKMKTIKNSIIMIA